MRTGDYTLTVPSDSLSSILQLKRQICGIAERDLAHLFVYSSDTLSVSSDGRQPINPERQRVIYLGRQLPDHIVRIYLLFSLSVCLSLYLCFFFCLFSLFHLYFFFLFFLLLFFFSYSSSFLIVLILCWFMSIVFTQKVSDAKIEETTVVQVFLRPLPTKK